jgi:hypothetical protein
LLSCEVPNGKIKSKSITSRASANSSTKDKRSITQSSKKSNNNNNDELTSITIDINQQNISQPETSPVSGATDTRSFQRMFACDLSQLPAENSELLDDDMDFFEEGDIMDSNNYAENVEVHNTLLENATNKSLPPIVIASGSQFSINKETPNTNELEEPTIMHQDSSDSLGLNRYFQTTKSPLLSAIVEADPFTRPLSRRGSRESTPEQGEEFADNLSTDSLQPLGDKGESPQNKMANKNPEITFELSSSEDENDQPYHQLDEDAEIKEKSKTTSDEHYSSGDEERSDEHRMLDRHAYERLEESPPLSPTVDTKNSLPQVSLKSNSDEVVDMAEQTSDYEDLR